ncbi:MAG: ABC transporter ATP-binding protein [Spirochaetes bacterium]|nr:ABC transporter ATP-binding protein [Spirochaetota bacterium]
MGKDYILEIKGLVTSFNTESGRINAVEDITFKLKKGKSLGLVGESGCGKSVTALSILRLIPKPAGNINSGEVLFKNNDLLKINPDEMHKIRGSKIAMIFQEPMTALNPVHKIGKQITEMLDLHKPEMTKNEKNKKALDLLNKVGIPDPERRLNEYPHQLSGGIRQRVMIAMALSCDPEVLIADEPTTALDVTIQAQILDLIKVLQKENNMSIIFITHDLGVIAQMCEDVVVMYAGKIAEIAPVTELFKNPMHPYTKGLLESIPKLDNIPKTKLNTIKGVVPALNELPKGCRFQNRCPYVMDICKNDPPVFIVKNNHKASCFLLQGKFRNE